MEHAFNVNIAQQFGVEVAIFLQHVRYWTFKNLANRKHIYDGLCWTYNTLEAFTKIFPYWTQRQLERIIKACIENELLVKGNYNTTKYDRTTWYALTLKSYRLFPELCAKEHYDLLNKYLSNPDLSTDFVDKTQTVKCISPNGEMDLTKRWNGSHQPVKPIPSVYTSTNTNTKKDNINNSDLSRIDSYTSEKQAAPNIPDYHNNNGTNHSKNNHSGRVGYVENKLFMQIVDEYSELNRGNLNQAYNLFLKNRYTPEMVQLILQKIREAKQKKEEQYMQKLVVFLQDYCDPGLLSRELNKRKQEVTISQDLRAKISKYMQAVQFYDWGEKTLYNNLDKTLVMEVITYYKSMGEELPVPRDQRENQKLATKSTRHAEISQKINLPTAKNENLPGGFTEPFSIEQVLTDPIPLKENSNR